MFSAVLTISFLALCSNAIPTAITTRASPNAQKYVFAHHIVGNTRPYEVSDWANDIALAHANGIDAFALNVGGDNYQPLQVAQAYEAAGQSNFGFKLFISFDMNALPCIAPTDATLLLDYIGNYSTHPAQFMYPPSSPKAFVSTFGGDACTFGQGSSGEGWESEFKDKLPASIFFVPSFFGDPSGFASAGYGDVMDGDFSWDSAWPFTLTTSTFSSMLSSVGSSISGLFNAAPNSPAKNLVQSIVSSFSYDTQHINAMNGLGDKIYMAAVSPWFFTHYSPQSYNKNWIFLADTLYPSRWTTLVSQRDLVDLVEIVSWNDFGESHYIGPIEGEQPDSQAWVDGMSHTAWLDMTNYYATAFKTGSYPAIEQDKIYLWARTHPTAAQIPSDTVGRPANADLAEDALFALVMATQPSSVTLSTGNSPAQTFSVPSGVTQLSVPIIAGGTMSATLTRNGQSIVQLQPNNFTFNGNPTSYNFNAFVTMAPA